MRIFTTLFFIFLFYKSVFAQNLKKDFYTIKPGMHDSTVKRLVGEPEFIENFKTVNKITNDTTLFWRYEKGITVIMKNHFAEIVERDFSTILQHIQEWADPKNKDNVKLLLK